MDTIKPWEKLSKALKTQPNAYILRIGDSKWGLDTYEYGYRVGIIREKKDGKHILCPDSVKYPSTLESVQYVVRNLGHDLAEYTDGFDEAVKGTIKATAYSIELSERIGELSDAA